MGNLDELIEDGIVDNKEQFEECWAEEYPDEYCWYRLTTSNTMIIILSS